MAVVTRTGLSPEFHLADGKSGTAGAFLVRGALLFVDCNQSVNNHRSNERLLLMLLWILLLLLVSFVLSSREAVIISSGSAPPVVSVVMVVVDAMLVVVVVGGGAAARNSSRYSLTGPLALEMANLVLDTGTTCVFQTMAATMLMTTTILMPIKTCGSGRMASNCCRCCCCCDCCCIVLDNNVGDMVVVDVAIHVEVQDDVADDADEAAWMKGD
jgi:hypothetical protein